MGVAIVTGGASGMGLAIARRLAAGGHAVGVLDLDGARASEVADCLVADGGTGIGIATDVADAGSVRDAVERVRSSLGAISILVTSAGIAPYDDYLDIDQDSWQRVLAVNLTGTFLCTQAVLPDMVDARWGRIVTISSAAGQWGTARMAHYSAAKGGVIALTKALAREFGPNGITVNTLPPGLIATPMSRQAQSEGNIPPDELVASRILLGRVGTAEEIAATCAFLCSEEAGYITGQVVAVNGGMVL